MGEVSKIVAMLAESIRSLGLGLQLRESRLQLRESILESKISAKLEIYLFVYGGGQAANGI